LTAQLSVVDCVTENRKREQGGFVNVPQTPTGQMRVCIREKDAAAGLARRAVQFTRTDVRLTLKNEYQLAQKPFAWLKAAVALLYGQESKEQQRFRFGGFIAQWERAVQHQLPTAQRDIAAAIYGRSGLIVKHPVVKIVIVGTGQVKLCHCPLPLCFAEMVDYAPIDPEDFTTTFLQRFRRLPPFNQCNHRIPVPAHAQAVIASSLAMYTMYQQTQTH
jgi:hypothetical protein